MVKNHNNYRFNNLKNYLFFSLLVLLSISLFGCEIGNGSIKNDLKDDASSKISYDNLYFNNIQATNSVPIYSNLDTMMGVTNVGSITYTSNGFSVAVSGEHHGSPDVALWMVSWGLGGFNTGTTNVESDNFNYAYMGDMNFYYNQESASPLNNQSFTCRDIGIAEIHAKNGKDTWMLYSNISPGLAVISDYTDESQAIRCVNTATGVTQIFTVSGYNEYTFTITANQNYSSANFGIILDNATFGQQLAYAYKNLSSLDSLTFWANNEYGLANNTNNYYVDIFEPRNFDALAIESGTANLSGPLTIRSDSEAEVGTDTLTNSSDVQQTLTTSVVSKQVTDTVTTTNTNSVNVGGAISLKSGFLTNIIAKEGIDVNLEYSYQNGQAVTNTVTYTYTASPQSILLPPHTSAEVTTTLEQGTVSGNFVYQIIASGTIPTDGILFYALEGSSAVSIPSLLPSQQNVNIYDVFANTTAKLDPQIGVNESNHTVILYGGGSLTGNVSTNYKVTVNEYPIESDGTISNTAESTYSFPVQGTTSGVSQLVMPANANNHTLKK